MATRDKIIEILNKWDYYSKEFNCQIIKEFAYDAVASEILPFIEKRDEIIKAYEDLRYYQQRTDTSKEMARESSDKIIELRQRIENLKKEIE